MVCFEKDILGDVKCILGVANNGENHAVNAGVMAQVEEIERDGFARLKAGNQVGIR